MKEGSTWGRRLFLCAGAATLASAAVKPALAAIPRGHFRSVAFDNLHTGERLKVDYWVNGRYVPDALGAVNHLLRDFRTGDVFPIDPQLLDLLDALRRKLGSHAPYQVISGYRSPKTNAMLREFSDGVAANSLHMQGMAIDIRVPDRMLRSVRRAAMSLYRGGVGYYPRSDFVHVDVGRVRHW
ncbi:MAG TPA: DUF882 domain-containing protein [Alphaproteobacteria bacterium]|nr:DUF882 domain-containing protein [Alphaproteobacteria bacterium]